MSKKEVPPDDAPTVEALSKRAQRIAKLLSELAQYCQHEASDKNDAELVHELGDLVNDTYQPILLLSDYFAGVGGVNDTLVIANRSYSSAHVAAVLEARILLEYLWIKLDKEGWDEARAAYTENPYTEAGQKFFNATGLDPKVLDEKWPEAKCLMRDFLNPDWYSDPASARVKSERAALKGGAPNLTAPSAPISLSDSEENRKLFDSIVEDSEGVLGWINHHVRLASEGRSSEKQPAVPTGFVGIEELMEAFQIPSDQREAFEKKLNRGRSGLGDHNWHEVRDPRPNHSRFLYRADAPELRTLATRYQKGN